MFKRNIVHTATKVNGYKASSLLVFGLLLFAELPIRQKTSARLDAASDRYLKPPIKHTLRLRVVSIHHLYRIIRGRFPVRIMWTSAYAA